MMNDFIIQAQTALAAAEERLARLRPQVDEAEKAVAKYRQFLATAEELSGSKFVPPVIQVSKDGLDHYASNGHVVRVQTDGLCGLAAKLIQDHGPQTLTELIARLRGMGKDDTDAKNFRTVLNSALWRRRNDLFEMAGGKRYALRPGKIEYIQPVPK